MRKKFLTFLLALTASIGMMWAETVVVINKSEFTSSGVTKEGVTLALSNGSMTSSDPLAMDGSFEFSTSLGKFTGITIETDINIMEIYEGAFTSAGWPTGDNLGTSAVWTGESETVFISCMVAGMDITITCTIEPAPTTEDVDITPYADPQHANVYYSTFFDSSVKYELPAGVEAYVADLSGANLLLTKIAEAGEVIPANVAVILKSTVTPFTLTVSDADAVTFTATNDLQGSDTQIATPDNCYVLAGNDGVVGFYHYTAANLNAHKAYVVYSGSNQAPRRMPFIFDQATGVENVQNSDIRSQKVVENGQLIIIRNGVRYNAAGQNVK